MIGLSQGGKSQRREYERQKDSRQRTLAHTVRKSQLANVLGELQQWFISHCISQHALDAMQISSLKWMMSKYFVGKMQPCFSVLSHPE